MESFTNKWVLDTSVGANLSLNLFDHHSNTSTNSVLTSPSPSVDSISGSKVKIHLQEQDGKLAEELKRMKVENKQLTQKMAAIRENFKDLQIQLIGLMSGTNQFQSINFNTNKRNNNNNNEQSCISFINDDDCLPCKRARLLSSKPKVFRTFIPTDNSDSTQVVKDGYEWRKYGQKVTKDNPSPRAYFKCAQAPICPVKKKVQRSVDDPDILVATYEGEHNHAKPDSINCPPTDHIMFLDSNHTTNQCFNTSIPKINLDLVNPNLSNNHSKDNNEQEKQKEINTKALQRLLVDQMATSLARDPSFTSALAKAISEKMMDKDFDGRWL